MKFEEVRGRVEGALGKKCEEVVVSREGRGRNGQDLTLDVGRPLWSAPVAPYRARVRAVD